MAKVPTLQCQTPHSWSKARSPGRRVGMPMMDGEKW